MKMRSIMAVVFAAVFLLSQTLSVAAHCLVDKVASAHSHHQSEPDGHTHSSDHASDISHTASHNTGAHDQSAPGGDEKHAPDPDFSSAYGDCTMGSPGVEPATEIHDRHVYLRSTFAALVGTAMVGSTPAQPTPPPNSVL